MKLQTRLKKLRIKQHLTQIEAANQLNVSRKTISSWENGRTIPDAEMMAKLADLYHDPLTVTTNRPLNSNDQTPIPQTSPARKKNYWLITFFILNTIVFIMSMMNFLNNDFYGVGFLQLIIDAIGLIYLNHVLILILRENKTIIVVGLIWFLLFVYLFVLKSYTEGHSTWPLIMVILKSIWDVGVFTYLFIILISSGYLYKRMTK